MPTKAEMKIIDSHVGQRLRELCILKGITQEKLGELTGVTFQQIQKRMSGANRMGSSALFVTAKALDTPITYFFEGLDDDTPPPLDNTMTKRETLELVRSYHAIQSFDTRKRIFDLTKTVAREEAKALASVRRPNGPTTPEVHRRAPA